MGDFKPEIAIVLRSDEVIKDFNLKRVTINTSFGPVHRCYIGYIYDVPVLVIYGRFNSEKVPSHMINFEQTVEAVKNSGATKMIGTFVVGGIKKDVPAGTVYILRDMVGFGNYQINWNQNETFRNAEMFEPFCRNLTDKLVEASKKMDFPVVEDATYVTFYGYPRLETRKELEFFERQGWDIVGQTCDPEATMARLNHICYAGLAVKIDSPIDRADYIKNLKEKNVKSAYVESIKSCRERTTKIVLEFLRDYKHDDCDVCTKISRKNHSFLEFPESFYE